jgi:hypothetical protein
LAVTVSGAAGMVNVVEALVELATPLPVQLEKV